MRVYLATDHAGFELKERLKAYLVELGYEVLDHGAHIYDSNDDYPDFISLAAKEVSENGGLAVIFGGSGQGEAMVANRFKRVRAAVIACENLDLVRLAREHNDVNVLSIGARFVSEDFAKEAVHLFLSTKFSNEERHKRRLEKLKNLNT